MRTALVWALLVAAAVVTVVAGVRQADGWLDTDITRLIPAEHRDGRISRVLERDRPGLSGELLVLLRGPEESVLPAARAARDPLLASGVLSQTGLGEGGALVESLMPYRFGLLTEARREAFRDDPAAAYLGRVRQRLARPSPAFGPGFDRDPAGLLIDYISSLPAPYPGFRERDGVWQRVDDGQALGLLPMRIEGGAFEATGQEAVAAALAAAEARAAAECGDCEFLASGPVLFATEQRQRARAEIRLLSSLSLTGILLLVLFAFRSPRPILLGILALATGVLMAAAVSLLLFSHLHAITLIAGTTLLGIAIDYVFKYLVHRSEGGAEGSGRAVVRALRRPLLLGVSSSLLCLVVLALSPLPVMRELAVFSAAGLAGAWLTVVLVFPLLDGCRPARLAPSGEWLATRPLALFSGLGRWRWVLPVLAIPLGVVAVLQMPGTDDLRDFQSPMPEQEAEDRTLRSLTGTAYPEGFFLVSGPDVETVLQREAALVERLDASAGHRRAMALSRFMPPPSVQAESRRLVGEALNSERFGERLREYGLPAESLDELRAEWAQSADRYLSPAQPVTGPLASLANGLWLAGEAPSSLVIPRGGATGLDADDTPAGVSFVQPVTMMNANLSEQREGATRWILAAAVTGLPLLFVLMLGPARGARAVLAPLSALSLTLVFLWLTGVGLNTFVLMGVILGLGVGADYAAFLAVESRPSGAGVTGIALAALTSMLAFGLLGLSGVPALGDFGLTVVVAIIAAWLSAFTLAATRPEALS